MHFHWGGYQLKNILRWELSTLCYQALHNKNFPEYLKLSFALKKRLLRARNDNGAMVEISRHRNSFTSRATNLFNELPEYIRQLNKENTFKSETKKYFYDRALETKKYFYDRALACFT